MEKIDKIIQILRNLKEENGMVVGSGPTNSTNKSSQSISVAGLPPDSPPVRPKRNIYLGLGSRKRWMINYNK